MTKQGWRIAMITTVTPVAEVLSAALRKLGHEPVAVISARRPTPGDAARRAFAELSDSTAPPGIDVLIARDRLSMEPLLRAVRPDLAICWGFPWRIPLETLQVPRLGSINSHPALLPRHRGPIPISWTIREGDPHYGMTWHRMDADLDTGGILAQGTVEMRDDEFGYLELGPRLVEAALELLPRALERVAAGDPGDPQSADGVTWAGHFGDDYVEIDWSKSARAIHDQVRAWAFTSPAPLVGPVAELDGQRVRITRTTLVDPGDGARRMETGDGPIWIVESEPVETEAPTAAAAAPPA